MFYLPLTGGGTLHQLPRRGSGPNSPTPYGVSTT